MNKPTGRSMIEMLAVLAIIGVMSIGGLLGYRRAVNNHHANTILDDVNRFAFVILEKSGMPLGEDIDKGDFKESGLYQLTGFQGEDAGQFAITVRDVPKGVCEPLLTKAVIQYKVGITPVGGSQDDEIFYDTLNTDLCLDNNDITFYFGDTSGICNESDGDGPTPCTTNSDCCGGEFCVYVNANDSEPLGNGNGQCETVESYEPDWAILSDGQRWVRNKKVMNGWSMYNFCAALGTKMTNRAELNCSGYKTSSTCVNSFVISNLKPVWAESWYYKLNECRVKWKNNDGVWVESSCVITNRDWPEVVTDERMKTKGHALCH